MKMNLFMSLLGWYKEVRRPRRCQEAYLPSDAMTRLTYRHTRYNSGGSVCPSRYQQVCVSNWLHYLKQDPALFLQWVAIIGLSLVSLLNESPQATTHDFRGFAGRLESCQTKLVPWFKSLPCFVKESGTELSSRLKRGKKPKTLTVLNYGLALTSVVGWLCLFRQQRFRPSSARSNGSFFKLDLA